MTDVASKKVAKGYASSSSDKPQTLNVWKFEAENKEADLAHVLDVKPEDTTQVHAHPSLQSLVWELHYRTCYIIK